MFYKEKRCFLFVYPHAEINSFLISTNQNITTMKQVMSGHLALDLPVNMYEELYVRKATGCFVLNQQGTEEISCGYRNKCQE